MVWDGNAEVNNGNPIKAAKNNASAAIATPRLTRTPKSTWSVVGSARKIAYLSDELGFDAAINYKTEDIGAALDHACPDGINVYFENVGGVVAEAVYPRLAGRARVVVCGGVSEYNLIQPQTTLSNLQNILFTEARVGGFNIFSYEARYDDGRRRLARWLAEGRLKYKEDVVDGLENAAASFLRFFEGETFGKLLVKVAE